MTEAYYAIDLDEPLKRARKTRARRKEEDDEPPAYVGVPIWAWCGFGKPRRDENGMPLYEPWETVADGLIHTLGVLFTAASVGALLNTSLHPRYWVYSLCTLLIFCTSASYNMVGCVLRIFTEQLRRIDQASIFIAIGGLYTVFALDWRLLAAVWFVCGSGALMKVILGRRFEGPAILCYIALGAAPLALLRPGSRAYPTIAGSAAAVAVGGVFGYMNNKPGGTPFWHACILGASVAMWVLIYGTAKDGVASYL